MSTDGDIAALTYEQALAELDTLIQRLEGGAVNLDEAIAAYERASRLAQRCAELLDSTEQKITQLVVGPTGAQERAFSADAVPSAAPEQPSGSAAAAAQPVAPPPDAPRLPSVPPPPSAPVHARAVRPDSPVAPALPGLEPPARGRRPEIEIDPDDIPF
ncbi:MAG TPA: exodeoxyribonuclease VII small subunit [Candidatus Dormibacteraeota bacterium]|jgi:exodeoxyribonuclease VII small subunit|nr:exodeoxyribonuclease VII small subunit [Candidatus Dormibacteraeota bacterium]